MPVSYSSKFYQLLESLWQRIQPLLPSYKTSRKGGRPRPPLQNVVQGILYVLRTGCQWKAMPVQFGSGSAIHAYFQEWVQLGVFEKLWREALQEHDDLQGIDWTWQSLDGAMTKAPLGGKKTGKNPIDRGKLGVKRSTMIDGLGVLLGMAIDGANVHDQRLVQQTLSSTPVRRPRSTPRCRQHLCADKGRDTQGIRQFARRRGDVVHTPPQERIAESSSTLESPRPSLGRRTDAFVNKSCPETADPLGK